MKALKALLVPAIAAFGLGAAGDLAAQTHGSTARSSGMHSGASTRHWSGTHSGTRHWNGGHWSGGHWSGRHWGSHWHGSRIGFYFGVPVLWGAWYWGWPYYYEPYYYPRTVIYRDVVREPYPEGELGPPADATPGPGAPTQGPLYMNYCESAKAYYPKVTSCPEGWKFVRPGN